MKLTWILQKNLTKKKDLESLKDAIRVTCQQFLEIDIIPFSRSMPEIDVIHGLKIVYGSSTLMLNAYKDPRFKQAVFYDPDKFNMIHYKEIWQTNFLNFDGIVSTLKGIDLLAFEKEELLFVKPNNDTKSFEAKVLSFSELKAWAKKVSDLQLLDFGAKTEIFIASPKNIEKEWRSFIVDGKVISTSKYLENGILNQSKEDVPIKLIEFIEQRIEEYELAKVYVIDICMSNEEYKIIECNCFNGTGFYDHDIESIVDAIDRYFQKLDI